MKKNDGTEEKVNTKNILIATGSDVMPFPGIEVSSSLYSHMQNIYQVSYVLEK